MNPSIDYKIICCFVFIIVNFIFNLYVDIRGMYKGIYVHVFKNLNELFGIFVCFL